MVIHSTSTSDKIEHIFCFQCKEAPTRPDTRRSSIPKSEASGFELKISQQRASNCSSCLRRCLKVTQNDKGAFWLRGSVIILFCISFYLQREKNIYRLWNNFHSQRERLRDFFESSEALDKNINIWRIAVLLFDQQRGQGDEKEATQRLASPLVRKATAAIQTFKVTGCHRVHQTLSVTTIIEYSSSNPQQSKIIFILLKVVCGFEMSRSVLRLACQSSWLSNSPGKRT